MRTHRHFLNNVEPVDIHYVETDADLPSFEDWLRRPRRALAVDTETTGVGWRDTIRLAQFGDPHTAYVLRADAFRGAISAALRGPGPLTLHHAPFDLLKLEREGFVPVGSLWGRVVDTKLLAHLIDPRAQKEGGVGLGLKALSAKHVDPDAPDTQEGLTKVFNALGFTKETGWAGIPIDHPTYVLYAGLDVIFTARLLDILGPDVKARGLGRLSDFEHAVARVVAAMQRRGLLLDVPYTERLVGELAEEAARWEAVARRYGVDNVNSTDQVRAALLGMGETLTALTDSGNLSTDKAALLPLADLDREWRRIEARKPNPLAEAILRAKQAGGFGTKYAAKFLAERDEADRVHASIKSLEARTARMAIAQPPLQQLPSGDWQIRRCFVADPGQAIFSCDYSQVEMRVLAALSADKGLLALVHSGVDIFDGMATDLFGAAWTKVERKLTKNVGYGKVYGGGEETLVRQSGASLDAVRRARRLFDSRYPGVRRYARTLVERAEHGAREVITPSGRRLPLDRDRLYAATNYVVQSTARDVLAQALLDLDEAGLTRYLLLPVHDECLGQAPVAEVEGVAQAVAEVMAMDFMGVRLKADPEVYGPSWGSGYGAPSEVAA